MTQVLATGVRVTFASPVAAVCVGIYALRCVEWFGGEVADAVGGVAQV